MFGTIENAAGERLDHTLHEGAHGRDAIVVIGHGVTGNKDRPWAVALAEGLAAAGIAALRVSFAGNGSSGGDFEAATVSKEVEDLGAVLDALAGRRIAYAGHSMGGAVGLLRASTDRRVRWLVSLAGMVDVHAFAQRKFGHLTPGRDCMWERPECPLSHEYMDDMARLGNLEERAALVRAPWLLVHGTADDVVPLADSRAAYGRANGPKQLVEIDGCDHVFSEHTPEMVETVVRWLTTQIS